MLNKRLINSNNAASGGACASDALQVLGDTSCVALYPLNYDGSDVSGNYDGTTTDVSFSNGKIDEAANFNGSSSQLNLPTSFNTNIIDATGTFTLSMWIKMNDITTSQYLFAANTSNNIDLGVNTNSQGVGKVVWTIYNGSYGYLISTTTITTGVWYNVVVKYNNGTSEMFIDNVSQGTLTKTLVESSQVPTIGYRNTTGAVYTNGLIDQVRIFNKAISASEVTTLYGETQCSRVCTTDTNDYPTTNVAYYKLDGNAEDEKGSYDGTASNVSWTQGRFGSAAGFNGSSSTITTSTPNGHTQTWSLWVNIPSSSSNGIVMGALNTSGDAGQGWSFSYSTNKFFIYDYIGGSQYVATEPSFSTFDTWVHFAWVKSGTTSIMYKNGVSFTTLNAYSGNFQTGNNINLGRGLYGNTIVGMKIDQVRIFSSVLTAAQVTDLYSSEFQCPSTSSFKTVLYTGDGTTGRTIAGVNFQPDFVWQKQRNGTTSHILTDSVRGLDKSLISNSTNAEFSQTYFSSFNKDGFTFNNSALNSSNETGVAWNFKAGGDAITNTVGSRNSEVSANPNGAFSIVKYTGNSTSGATVGHGMNTPELIIYKRTDATANWIIKSSLLSVNDYLLFTSAAKGSDSGVFWNSTYPTSSLFTLGNSASVNVGNYIAYCFASVAGVSKIGSYAGQSATHTISTVIGGDSGFEPSWILIKNTTGSAGSWWMYDSSRNPTNPRNTRLTADVNYSEATNSSGNVNFISNGFQLLGNYQGTNLSGDTYIYMVFK